MAQQAIQDGVGHGGVTDDGMPIFERWEICRNGRENFAPVISFGLLAPSQNQIVYDERLDFGQAGQHLEM